MLNRSWVPMLFIDKFMGEILRLLVSVKCRKGMEPPAEFSLFYVNHQLILLLALPEAPS